MDNKKFTAEPWGQDEQLSSVVRAGKYIRIEQTFEVENMPRYLTTKQMEEIGEANAKLIAAAPDMLEFIKELVDRYGNSPWIAGRGQVIFDKATK